MKKELYWTIVGQLYDPNKNEAFRKQEKASIEQKTE